MAGYLTINRSNTVQECRYYVVTLTVVTLVTIQTFWLELSYLKNSSASTGCNLTYKFHKHVKLKYHLF